MSLRPVLAVALLVAAGLAGCAQDPASDDPGTTEPCPDPPQGTAPDTATDGTLEVTLNTTEGDIVVELFHQRAPVTVANFVGYAASGFYEGTIFHRVISGFVIQGGGLDPDLNELPTRDPIPLERHPDLENERATLSMARTQRPHSATSQFFVNLADNTDTLGRGAGYAVFGEVVQGMDVVDAIANVSTHQEGGREDVPEEDIVVRNVTVDLPDDGTDPAVRVAAVHGTVHPAPDADAQAAFQVVNGWDTTRQVDVEPLGNASSAQVPHAAGDGTLTLEPGASALAVASVPAGTNGTAGVAVEGPDGRLDAARTQVCPSEGTGPAVDADANPRADVRYTGLFEIGVPFDSNQPDLDERPGLRIPPNLAGDAPLFQVWAGDGESPDENYTRVIPGFRDAVRGLQQGQGTLVEVPSEEGYQDGVTRWFHVAVEDVPAP